MKLNILEKIGLGDLKKHGFRGILSFWLLLFLAFFLFGDQNLISPNLRNIASSLEITDQKDIDWKIGGVIPILFFILGGAVSLSMGGLTQIYSRKVLLIFTVLLGEIPCLLTAYSSTYFEFVFYRTLTGFGLGGMFPLLFSMVGDFFSPKSRATASGYVSLAIGLGVGVGQLLGGILGNADPINGWRTSFVYMAVPSFFFIALYAIFSKEPKRGGMDRENSEDALERITFNDVKLIFKSKTNLGAFLQGIPGCVPWGVFFVFLVDYYETVYKLEKNIASSYVTIAAVGVFLGIFFGGVFGQKFYNIRPRFQALFCMVTTFLGIFPCLFLLKAEAILFNTPLFLGLNLFAGFLISITGANVRAILINVNRPETRSAVFALYNLTDDLGKGLGPAISALILFLIPDRTTALSVSIWFWAPCSLFWFLIYFNYESDEKEMKQKLAR